MQLQPMYTIGHGTRIIAYFIQLLNDHHIQYLADVRSLPYSRFNPQYRQKNLQDSLAQHGITYIFMGDSLGGRPNDRTCYDAAGKVDYETIKTKPFFKAGIERLKTACSKNIPLALMCSESNPAHCHRSKLIAPVLSALDIHLQHIDEKGTLKTQEEVMGGAKGLFW